MASGLREVVDGGVDLLLGGRCVGCARPGRLLCRPCAAALPAGGHLAWPTPVPVGLVPPWAAGEYAGTLRAMVVGHKERRLLGLRAPLAELLAGAVATAVAGAPRGPVLLVPVPSRRGSARARGHDPTAAVTRAAGRRLRAAGLEVVVHPLLRSRAGVVDQAGLGAEERAANLTGSMCCPTPALRRLARRTTHARVIVCDDVVTTGSTLREAQRALEEVGLTVLAAAAVAATRRRTPAPVPPTHGGPPALLSGEGRG